MGTIPLDAAVEQFSQSMSDLQVAVDSALASERVADRLAMTTCLTALRYVDKHGMTESGRKQLRTAIECCRSVLGLEE